MRRPLLAIGGSLEHVFAVVAESGGHEPDSVYSVWSTLALAEAEILRVNSEDLHIVKVGIDQPSDEWVGHSRVWDPDARVWRKQVGTHPKTKARKIR